MNNLIFYFLNVGKGNCSIMNFTSGRLTVIDIDDSRSLPATKKAFMEIVEKKAKLTNPVDYITNNFKDTDIFRFILTHPDLDHLSGIKELYNRKPFQNFWDTAHNKYIDPNSWQGSPYDKEDWDFYQRIRKSTEHPTVLNLYREQTGNYWTDDGIEILSPTPEIVKETNQSNNDDYDPLSYILRVHYAGKKILLGGDATEKIWTDIIFHYGAKHLKSDVLLAPNHGSPNHISKEILDAINPDLTVVSVAEGVEYARELYSRYGKVLSTKHYGNIWVGILDNGDVYFQTELNEYQGNWHKLSNYDIASLLRRV